MRLWRGDGHDLWLIRWPKAAVAPLHDHGGAAGAAAVIEGELCEHVYVDGPAPSWQLRRWRPDAVTVFGPDHLHEVRNDGDRAAYSLHLYAPGLDSMTYFVPGAYGRVRPAQTETRRHWA